MNNQEVNLTIRVPADLYARLNEAVPWGLRKHLVASVIEVVVNAIEKEGPIVTGAVMAGQFKLMWEPPKEAA